MKDGKAVGFEVGFDAFEIVKVIAQFGFGQAQFLSQYFEQNIEFAIPCASTIGSFWLLDMWGFSFSDLKVFGHR